MKILVFYNPRSKSTITHEILAKKFNLAPWGEILTLSRRKNQHHDEYPALIQSINNADNICVKTGPTDFIDQKQQQIKPEYKQINWQDFDHVVFVKRDNIFDTIMSYGYQNQHNPSLWHRAKGAQISAKQYTIDRNRMYYILRAYRLYPDIENYICSQLDPKKIHHYEYETLEQQLKMDFNLLDGEMITSTDPNEIDYRKFATNYTEILNEFQSVRDKFLSASADDIANKDSFFWQNKTDYT